MQDRDSRLAIVLGLQLLVATIYISLTKGAGMNTLLWNGESVGIFPDLFESIRDACERKPYEGQSIYPAFAYLLCWFLSLFTPGDVNNWSSFSMSSSGNFVGYMFFAITTFLIIFICYKQLEEKKSSIFIMIALCFSPGYIYCIERGNMVILAVLFMLVFLSLYDSEDLRSQWVAVFCLACAASMKLYPVFFGLLLIKEKKYKLSVKAILTGFIVFFSPFFLFGGIPSIIKMMQNIISLSAETGIDTRGFGVGYKINIGNMVEASCTWLGINEQVQTYLNILGLMLVIILALAILLLAQQKWEKIWALTMIVTLLPGFSWIYNSLYFILPFVFFLKKSNNSKIASIFYEIGYLLIFMPLPYGFIMRRLSGVNKMSISTMANFVGAMLISIVLVLELFVSFVKKKKTKKKNQVQFN